MNTLKFNYNTHTNNYKTSMKEQEKKNGKNLGLEMRRVSQENEQHS